MLDNTDKMFMFFILFFLFFRGCGEANSLERIEDRLGTIEHRIDSLTENNQRVDVLEKQMDELLSPLTDVKQRNPE